MNKFFRWMKMEIDVEFFACVHAMSMIFVYGFLLWLDGVPSVTFAAVIEFYVLAYLSAWLQKALFLRERVYPQTEYWIREILWCLAPVLLLLAAGSFFPWFGGRPVLLAAAFYVIMLFYHGMVWVFLRYFYRKDTEELNGLLNRRREEKNGKTRDTEKVGEDEVGEDEDERP